MADDQKIYQVGGSTYTVETIEQSDGAHRQVFHKAASTGIANGAKTVASAGTAEPLTASATPCTKLIMTAEDDNTGKIYYGGSSVSSSSGDYLFPAQKVILEIDDLNKVYIDAEQDTDGVKFSYLTAS